MSFGKKVLAFYKSLSLDQKLPAKVEVMNPYQDALTFNVCQQFYQKFYNDSNTRTMILGINPGRMGGSITGVPFTDPEKLERYCGIASNFIKKRILQKSIRKTLPINPGQIARIETGNLGIAGYRFLN